MRRLLGLALATVTAMALLALTAGQALASHVHCGDVITQDTTLDSDLICPPGAVEPGTNRSGPALKIEADGVALNLAGHVVRQEGQYPVSIRVAASDHCPDDVTVQNGLIDGDVDIDPCSYRVLFSHLTFADGSEMHGRNNGPAIVEHSKFEGVDGRGGISIWGVAVIRHNVFEGGNQIWIRGGGLAGELPDTSITDNVISDMTISLFKGGAQIARNRISGNDDAGIELAVAGGWIHDNVITGNGVGVEMGYAYPSIEHNEITRNVEDGVHVNAASNVTLEHNNISNNGGNGVWVNGYPEAPLVSAQVTANRIVGNRSDGVYMGQCQYADSLVDGNITDRNGDDGIEVVAGPPTCYHYPDRPTSLPTVTGNHAWWNGDLGIEAAPGTLGGGNWAKHNGNPLQCVPGSLCSTTGKPKGI